MEENREMEELLKKAEETKNLIEETQMLLEETLEYLNEELEEEEWGEAEVVKAEGIIIDLQKIREERESRK